MSHMIANPETYFAQWVPPRSRLLLDLEREAAHERIPIVGPAMGQLLYLLARMTGAKRIIELGTATGYSAIFMGQACRITGGRLTSIENDEAMVQRARANIDRAELTGWVDIRHEDALVHLQQRDDPAAVGMIFLDIEKIDYRRTLPECSRLLAAGGILIADNTGFKDADDFNKAVHDSPQWQSVNMWSLLSGHSPEYDGFCIAMKTPPGSAS